MNIASVIPEYGKASMHAGKQGVQFSIKVRKY